MLSHCSARTLGTSLLAVVVALGVAFAGGEARAGKAPNKAHKPHSAHGKVISVAVNADGTGSLTVEQHKHKKGQTGPGETVVRTYEVTAGTTFLVKDKAGEQPATAAALRQGEHVSITHKGKSRVAEKVVIGHHGKGKGKGKGKKTA